MKIPEEHIETMKGVLIVLAVVAMAAFWGLMVYVAWHFITKYW